VGRSSRRPRFATENIIKPLFPRMSDRQFLLTLRIHPRDLHARRVVFALNSKQDHVRHGAERLHRDAGRSPGALAAGIFWKRANNLGALGLVRLRTCRWLAAAFFAPDATVPPPLVGLGFPLMGMVVGALRARRSCSRHAHDHSSPH